MKEADQEFAQRGMWAATILATVLMGGLADYPENFEIFLPLAAIVPAVVTLPFFMRKTQPDLA